jgi:outer membrane protein assembly factor BamE (lipoprotein component of BamABCDE complex)
MKKNSNLILLLPICFIISCATAHEIAVAKVAEYDKLLNPLIADTKDEVLFQLGAPDSTQKLGSQEIWVYNHSYGEEGSSVNTFQRGFFNSIVGINNYSYHKLYDKITIYFNKTGRMTNYETFVQR